MVYCLPCEADIAHSETDTTSWILLQSGSQPGLYNYSIALPALQSGTFNVEAYEAVTSYHLCFSDNHNRVDGRLTKHGAFGVVAEGEAMLSEGIWGEPYAVRLEVTFTPDGAKEKRILASKIYKLEGWMR